MAVFLLKILFAQYGITTQWFLLSWYMHYVLLVGNVTFYFVSSHNLYTNKRRGYFVCLLQCLFFLSFSCFPVYLVLTAFYAFRCIVLHANISYLCEWAYVFVSWAKCFYHKNFYIKGIDQMWHSVKQAPYHVQNIFFLFYLMKSRIGKKPDTYTLPIENDFV